MVRTGFIMLQRELTDWEWYTDVNTCKLFLHCLLKVNYSKKRWQGILIEKDEFVTSYDKLAVETGLTVSKVRTALSKLEKSQDICIETTMSYTKVCILNMKAFVADSIVETNSTANDTPINKALTIVSQTDSNQLATTNTNNNNVTNRKKIFREKVFALSHIDNIILESFFDYWTELNNNKLEMRFESDHFFEIEKRVKKWIANERKFKNSAKTKTNLMTNR